MSGQHGQLRRAVSRNEEARALGNDIAVVCSKSRRAAADLCLSPANSVRTASPTPTRSMSPSSPRRGRSADPYFNIIGSTAGSRQMVEVPAEALQIMQVQISALTDRVLQLEELLSELHPSLNRSSKTLTPRPSAASLRLTGSQTLSTSLLGASGEVSPDRRAISMSSSKQAKTSTVAMNPAVDADLGPFCPQTGRPLTWLRASGSTPQMKVRAHSAQAPSTISIQTPRQLLPTGSTNAIQTPRQMQAVASTNSIQTPRKMQAAVNTAPTRMVSPALPSAATTPRTSTLVSMANTTTTTNATTTFTTTATQATHNGGPLDNSIPLTSYPSMQANVPMVSHLAVPSLISSITSKPPSLAALVTTPSMGLVRTRSAEPSRVLRSPQSQEALSMSGSPTNLGMQLQRARQYVREQSPAAAERSSSEPPAVSSDVHDFTMVKSYIEEPAATLQIVHVSTQEDNTKTSTEVVAASVVQSRNGQARDPRDPPTPRRRRTPTKAQSREDDGSTAPHVVLSLQNDKRTFLRKGSGTGRSRKNAPEKADALLV